MLVILHENNIIIEYFPSSRMYSYSSLSYSLTFVQFSALGFLLLLELDLLAGSGWDRLLLVHGVRIPEEFLFNFFIIQIV